MGLKVEMPELFKETLQHGINFFAGAGFSKLPDTQGNKLPDAKELCSEICTTFDLKHGYGNDLERISTIVNTKYKQRYQEFLREKFTVKSYNPLYDQINKININSFITTNIDNIIHCVMDNSNKYYLNSLTYYGATKRSKSALSYIPLHGDVKNIYSTLYFGKFDLATVDISNRDLFDIMIAKLMECPTLFIGYGFHDSGVERAIGRILESQNKKNIWIQCLPGNENIELYRDMNCYIIEGTTEDFLQWIRDELKSEEIITSSFDSPFLAQYKVPTINEVEAVPVNEYYINARTHWYNIIANQAFQTKKINEIHEASIANKNVIVVGIPFSGKTTDMMQLSLQLNSNMKLVVKDLTPEISKHIINELRGVDATILVDNCSEDMYAYYLLASCPNIKTIGFIDEHSFESTKHIISGLIYKKIDISELDLAEAQCIYEKIPQSLRTDNFAYKKNRLERFSMLEMMSNNVKNIMTESKIQTFLQRIKATTPDAFEVIKLTSYLFVNNSALSIDILCSYFNITNYDKISTLLSTVKMLLTEADIRLTQDEVDGEFYYLRSNLFSHYVNKLLMYRHSADYAETIKKFVFNVSPYKTYKYHVFKRTAYDAKLFYRLFNDEAHELYKRIYSYNPTAYTLQQWALYKVELKDYPGAFADIDKAITMDRYNFSIKNTRAIVLFEANKEIKTGLAITEMIEAMDILSECYRSDKRKVFHAQKYAEFALYFATVLSYYEFIDQAITWLKEISKDFKSYKTKELLNKLINIKR
ncbi:hypothetical protein GTO91_02820 [Heliobacterium undosum]|uniref:SIR2-like domain-containing protein n=1 Tax=Heliomicrobium undosum TaxID=121734 RepID=A0A845KY31_9FIRM|nr:SIR2 family protein [Heliomicrobium undosum]MZP28652.1 hypothetical protein [Heliomicrobium undosum]